MPRTAPPPWVRWIGLDCIASCSQLAQLADGLEMASIARGDPGATIAYLARIRKEIREIRDQMHQLQKATTFEDLARWLEQDLDMQTYMAHVLSQRKGESQHVTAS